PRFSGQTTSSTSGCASLTYRTDPSPLAQSTTMMRTGIVDRFNAPRHPGSQRQPFQLTITTSTDGPPAGPVDPGLDRTVMLPNALPPVRGGTTVRAVRSASAGWRDDLGILSS